MTAYAVGYDTEVVVVHQFENDGLKIYRCHVPGTPDDTYILFTDVELEFR